MTTEISVRQRDMLQNSLAFLTAVWSDEGCLNADLEIVEEVLGEIDYRQVAYGVAGIAQYFARAVASLEGQRDRSWVTGEEVLEDLCTQIALSMMGA